MELKKIKDFKKEIIEKVNKKEIIGIKGFTLLHYNIKKMFTNLNKKRVLHAVETMGAHLKRYRGTKELNFAIKRRKYEKYLNHMEKAYRYHKYNCSFQDMLNYVEFELKTSYFTVKDVIIKQKGGLQWKGYFQHAWHV